MGQAQNIIAVCDECGDVFEGGIPYTNLSSDGHLDITLTEGLGIAIKNHHLETGMNRGGSFGHARYTVFSLDDTTGEPIGRIEANRYIAWFIEKGLDNDDEPSPYARR